MINLVSTSPTRAKLLKESGFCFKQIKFDFNEIDTRETPPYLKPYKIVMQKQHQYRQFDKKSQNLLFADTLVLVGDIVLKKPKDELEAIKMLSLQSGNKVSISTAMIFLGKELNFWNLSLTTYEFYKFDQDELHNYITSGGYKGKAGGMSIEGFNKKYIKSQSGNTSTAMGLNIEILRRYLCL